MAVRSIVRFGASALLVAALVAPSPALAGSTTAPAVAHAAATPAALCVLGHSSACPIRIHFALGAYSGQAHSSLTGITSTRWFVVHLNKNQNVTVWVIGKGPTRGQIYFPGGGSTGQPGGKIYEDTAPKTGDYKIRVTESQMAEAWSGRVDVLVVAI